MKLNNRIVTRTATSKDLDGLVRLEESGFYPDDQFSREQLRYLVTRANATVFVLDDGKIIGSAIVLWRKRSLTARLYSIVISPKHQGTGLGSDLLLTCEREAARRGCMEMSLEVRIDNERAIAFYERHGYHFTESIPDFYADGTTALRMVKPLESGDNSKLSVDVPYYAQTMEFTCGPACLMMAMKYFDPAMPMNRSLELMIWKEATLIFMTSGLGGCGPFGLAVSALRRGYQAKVVLSTRKTPFLSSVRSDHKKEVIRTVHEQLKDDARDMGVEEDYFDFTFDDIASAMREGAVPIVLISTYRMHKVKAPHWVVVTGFDDQHVYFHDPYDGFYLPDKNKARHVRISISEFRKMRGYGKDLQKSVVFVSKRYKSASRVKKRSEKEGSVTE